MLFQVSRVYSRRKQPVSPLEFFLHIDLHLQRLDPLQPPLHFALNPHDIQLDLKAIFYDWKEHAERYRQIKGTALCAWTDLSSLGLPELYSIPAYVNQSGLMYNNELFTVGSPVIVSMELTGQYVYCYIVRINPADIFVRTADDRVHRVLLSTLRHGRVKLARDEHREPIEVSVLEAVNPDVMFSLPVSSVPEETAPKSNSSQSAAAATGMHPICDFESALNYSRNRACTFHPSPLILSQNPWVLHNKVRTAMKEALEQKRQQVMMPTKRHLVSTIPAGSAVLST